MDEVIKFPEMRPEMEANLHAQNLLQLLKH